MREERGDLENGKNTWEAIHKTQDTSTPKLRYHSECERGPTTLHRRPAGSFPKSAADEPISDMCVKGSGEILVFRAHLNIANKSKIPKIICW